jgi:cyanophycinase-like exopeptidase
MGRLLTFMARIRADYKIAAGVVSRGVGVDEHTALLLDIKTGDVQAVGVGTAYVCSVTKNAEICKSGVPLTYHGKHNCSIKCCLCNCIAIDIPCTRLSAVKKDTYSFNSFKGTGVDYLNDVTVGHITNIPYGPTSK